MPDKSPDPFERWEELKQEMTEVLEEMERIAEESNNLAHNFQQEEPCPAK